MAVSVSTKKKKKVAVVGVVNIRVSYNNIIVSVTDKQGNVIVWASGGSCGFKGSKRSTPYAAQVVVGNALSYVVEHGMKTVSIIVKGLGLVIDAAVKAVSASGLSIIDLEDRTPVPHNGCRLRKKRRV